MAVIVADLVVRGEARGAPRAVRGPMRAVAVGSRTDVNMRQYRVVVAFRHTGELTISIHHFS